MASPPTILDDKSGGYMLIKIDNGLPRQKHFMRVHLGPFAATPQTGATMIASGFAGIFHDYAYSDTGSANEASVGQTFGSLCNQLAGLYGPDWHFDLWGLWRSAAQPASLGVASAGDAAINPVWPMPIVPTVAGTSSGPGGSLKNWLASQVTLSMASLLGGKFRLVLLSSQEWDPTGEKRLLPGAYGVGVMQGLIAYLQGQPYSPFTIGPWAVAGAVSQITARDGGRLANRATLTNTMNRRLRRSYQYV